MLSQCGKELLCYFRIYSNFTSLDDLIVLEIIVVVILLSYKGNLQALVKQDQCKQQQNCVEPLHYQCTRPHHDRLAVGDGVMAVAAGREWRRPGEGVAAA